MHSLRDLQAPAKLNLFLHVTGRRADGYHLLESVFMRIDWCDTVHLNVRGDGLISREDLANPHDVQLGEHDLCVRAAQALKAALGTPLGAHIELDKRIPAQAGMGGGSSDAATVLLGLTRLWLAGQAQEQERVRREVLPVLALQLGADVPFFLLGSHALVWGIGEQMQPIDLPAAQFVVLKPNVGVSTPAIFKDAALERNMNSVLQRVDCASGSKLDIIDGFAADPYGFGRNCLQPVAQSLCPDVSRALAWLSDQGLQGRMTGSGSAVFAHLGAGSHPPDFSGLPEGWQARVCTNAAQGSTR
jgi:4-diphosphocytidyl-2-C-methyl-D-erythritol kinase